MPILIKSTQSITFHDHRPPEGKPAAAHALAPVPWTVPGLQSAPPSAAANAPLNLEDLKVKFLPTMAPGYEQAVYLEEIGGKERYFSIGKDELKWSPNWLESDRNFWSHLSAGSVQVLGTVQEDDGVEQMPEESDAPPPAKPEVKPVEPVKPPMPSSKPVEPLKPTEPPKPAETKPPENKSETK